MNLSDRCEHFSCPERSASPAVYILLYMCSAAVVLLTVCGNLLVIISVFHFKQLHTPTNMLVLSLAASDFLIGAFVMPPVFMWTIESCWIFGTGMCMCVMMTACFLMTFSIYNIVLIAIDRYLALSNPFLYMTRVSVSISCAAVFFDWCLVVAYNSALLYFNGNFTGFVMCTGQCFIMLNELWFIIDLVFSFIFPCSVIIILYTRVFVIAKKHATAIRELNNHTRPKINTDSMKSERKAAKVLGILVAVFLACLLPYFAYSLLGDIIQMREETFPKFLIMFCLNSTLNPLIYALFYPWFRKCVKLIITLQIFQTDSALINVLS